MCPRTCNEIELLRTQTRRLVDRDLRLRTLEIERERRIPDELVAKLRDLGYFGLTIPEHYGGLGLSTLAHLVVQEELARAHSAFNMLISGNNAIGVMGLVLDGTEAQKQRWLPRLASGDWIAALALTEPNTGSDGQAIQMRAIRDGDRFVLNGTKHFISRGDADVVTVFAVTDPSKRAAGGISTFIVEKGTPGFCVARIQDSMGSDVIKQAELVFENCAVGLDHVVGDLGKGFVTAMRTLDLGRLSLAARCLGTMEELLDVSADYARNRVQFGRRLAEQPVIQHMLADTATDIAVLRPALYALAQRRDDGKVVTNDAAMLELFASEALGRAADRAVQIHGGTGFPRDCVVEGIVEGIYREARMMRIIEALAKSSEW